MDVCHVGLHKKSDLLHGASIVYVFAVLSNSEMMLNAKPFKVLTLLIVILLILGYAIFHSKSMQQFIKISSFHFNAK